MAAEEQPTKTKRRLRDGLQRYFLAGLLVFLPVAITLWFLGWVVELLDSVLGVLPKPFHPNSYLPIPIPRLGAVVTLRPDSFSRISYQGRGDSKIPGRLGKSLREDSGVPRHLYRRSENWFRPFWVRRTRSARSC